MNEQQSFLQVAALIISPCTGGLTLRLLRPRCVLILPLVLFHCGKHNVRTKKRDGMGASSSPMSMSTSGPLQFRSA